MITINLNISADFDDEAAAGYDGYEDFADAVCAHVTGGLDLINVNFIVYNDVSIDTTEVADGFN
jgi:hypothetical protein